MSHLMQTQIKQTRYVLRSAKQTGFTLLEVMIVLTILALMAGGLYAALGDGGDRAKAKLAVSQMGAIKSALIQFKLENGKTPSTDQGLAALQESGFYEKEPVDPWRNEYVYISPGQKGAYDLYSYGADGVEGGEGLNADIYPE